MTNNPFEQFAIGKPVKVPVVLVHPETGNKTNTNLQVLKQEYEVPLGELLLVLLESSKLERSWFRSAQTKKKAHQTIAEILNALNQVKIDWWREGHAEIQEAVPSKPPKSSKDNP